PRATLKPRPRKISTISAVTSVTGWREPTQSRRGGMVGSTASRAAAREAPARAVRRSAKAASNSSLRALSDAPASRRCSTGREGSALRRAVRAPCLRPRTPISSASRAAASRPATAARRARRPARSRGSLTALLVRLRDLRQLRERVGVAHREVGEHLPVDLDPGGLQAGHHPRVRDLVHPRGGADAGDPQAAEVALLLAAVAVGV